MVKGQDHPITTPKGSAVLTVILSVIGVFTPFFTSLETAQLFAGVAVLVILWLYAEDMWGVLRAKSGYVRLLAPVLSLLLIVGVAVGATLIVTARPASSPPPAAISPQDVSNAIDDALKRNNPPKPPMPQPVRARDYNIVIREAPLANPISASSTAPPTTKATTSPIADVLTDLRRRQIGSKAQLDCSSKKWGLQGKIVALRSQAAEMQNAFYYGKNDKLMSENLKKWTADVEALFQENSKEMPNVTIFRMATKGQNYTTFLGIHQSGTRVWHEMDAKSAVLQSISEDLGRDKCELEKDAAVAKCIQAKTC